MKNLALIFTLLLPAAAFAQQGRVGYSGFSLTSPLDVSVGQDQNFLVNRTPANEQLLILSLPAGVIAGAPNIYPVPLTDNAMLIEAPTVAFTTNSRRDNLAVTYQPEFELYQTNHDQDAWNHHARLNFGYKLSRQWSLTAGDEYISSQDPSRALQNVLLMLPRARFRENSFNGGLTFDATKTTSFSLRYDNTISLFGQNDPLQTTALDSTVSAVSFTASHMLTRNQVLRGTYSALTVAPINREAENDAQVDTTSVLGFKHPAHNLTLQYLFNFNRNLMADLSGGVVRNDLGVNYVYSIGLDKRLGANWVGGGYTRNLSFFATGMTGFASPLSSSNFYDVIQAHWRGQPTAHIGVHIEASASRGVYQNFVQDSQNLMARNRIDYRWTDRVVTYIQVETYRQNRNVYINAPLNRNRFFAGIEYSFSSEGDQRANSMNSDADNVSLTSHGRERVPNQ